ncbi:organic solute transporter subunit alpha [Entomortierella parvispora]|uniref:Organic solute transporter subunit alpha n=1 Tax=Entomortierella parvispora TaxID=205924 RepID=A0A9P3HJP4_9FUNG|nr:organic solute transporter subunit alpha [Entomortierella parvispora]
MSSHVCPDYDDPRTGPSDLLFPGGLNGKRHIIGWTIAGVCALISTLISFRLIYKHARNYTKPAEQRHIMRIVLMIPIYAVISFLSYRFYREAIYYETIRDCYEAFVIYSFFILLLTYLGDDVQTQRSKITGSEKRQLMFPLSCLYYNPLHENFLHWMKYGILQYVVIKPLCTIAAVVLQYYGLYCETEYSFHFGMVYITIVNFISVSVALYCMVLFYQTIKLEIQDHSPLLKFMCVKMVVFFCYWQTCLLGMLGSAGLLKPEDGWTVINVELGISSILICVEMVVFAILHVYSFSYRPYVIVGRSTPAWRSLQDAFNPMDMVREIMWACSDTVLMIQHKPLPVRDGQLSSRLQRAHVIRVRRRDRFLKGLRNAVQHGHVHGVPGSSDIAIAVDPAVDAIYQSTLRDEALAEEERLLSGQLDANAPLLQNTDDRDYHATSRV